MNSEPVTAFFYGLFMDESLLASKGIRPSQATVGYVDGYGLRIGRRATLVPDESTRAYGVLMTLPADDLRALYSEESVADYVSEFVSVLLPDGRVEAAVCYNLPEHKLEGANPEYANALLILAGKLGLPEFYLQQIKMQTVWVKEGTMFFQENVLASPDEPMKDSTLETLGPLLAALRGYSVLDETRPATFHLDGRDFIHFHETPSGIFADVLLSNGRVHMPVATAADQQELLERIEHKLESLESHDNPKHHRQRRRVERDS